MRSGFISTHIHLIAYGIVILIIVAIILFVYFYDKRKLSKQWHRVDYENFPMNNGYYKAQENPIQEPKVTQPSPLVCEYCGHKLTSKDVFCEFCGYKIKN